MDKDDIEIDLSKFTKKIKELFSESEGKHKISKSKAEPQEDKLELNLNLDTLLSVVKNKFAYYFGLIVILIVAYYIRTRNLVLLKGKYLLGLDPYYYYRLAGYILQYGKLPVIDMMRNPPLGEPTPFDIFPYSLAYWHKFLTFFWPEIPRTFSHIIYVPVFALLGLVLFFFFVKEFLGIETALLSTAFLAVIPGYLFRTTAGFTDHEVLAMVFMFASLYFLVLAWKARAPHKAILLNLISGFFGACMALTWIGYTFLILPLGMFWFAALLFTKPTRAKVLGVISWLVIFTAIVALLRPKEYFLHNIGYLIQVLAAAAFVIYLALEKLPLRTKIEKYLPLPAASAVLVLVLGVISNLFLKFVKFKMLIVYLTEPLGLERIVRTVSEQAQPFFLGGGGWWDSYNWVFVLGFLGSILLFYSFWKGSQKYSLLATGLYVGVLSAIIFGRFSPAEKYSAIVSFFSKTYLLWIFIFVGALVGIYFYTYYRERQTFESIFYESWQVLLFLILFIITAIIARSIMRFIFVFSVTISIAAGYFVVEALKKMWNTKYRAVSIAILIFVIFVLFSNAQVSAATNARYGSNLPGYWEQAMLWIKENTPKDAVIAHWWDYGYWTEAIAERRAVQDGGHPGGKYVTYLLARYGMLGTNDTQTLTYFKTHETTHLLISQEEIGKYHAFALIGSDKNLDRRSTIGIFAAAEDKEIRNGTRRYYRGLWPLDQDIIIGRRVLSEGEAYVVGFSMDFENNGQLTNPKIYLVDKSNQYVFDIDCVCSEGVCQRGFGGENIFGGCAVLAPLFSDQKTLQYGSLFYLSQKVSPTLMARLYMMEEENPYFKLVYTNNVPLGIYNGRPIGPLKIWEINYPPNIKSDECYLGDLGPEDCPDVIV